MKNDDPIPASPPSDDLPSRSGEVATEAEDDPRCGLVYSVVLSAERGCFIVGNRKVYVIPGMAVALIGHDGFCEGRTDVTSHEIF